MKSLPPQEIFNQFMTPFSHHTRFAVAVSGGADSMALMLLAHDWAQARNVQLIALTVDHRLRPDSTQEAQQVVQWAEQYGIPHVTLEWIHPSISGALQQKAREARYQLLEQYCQTHQIPLLLTAHHRDDQWETFFMRLNKGSGPQGLEGIRPIRPTVFGTLARPLLNVSSDELKAYLAQRSQPYIDDPSNQNTKFERVRWRKFRTLLPDDCFSTEVIHQTIEQISRQNAFVNRQIEQFIIQHVQINPKNNALIYASIDYKQWTTLDPFLQHGVLRSVLHSIGEHPYPPPFASIDRLVHTLDHHQNRTQTGAGCSLFIQTWNGQPTLFITPEPRHLPRMAVSESMRVKWGSVMIHFTPHNECVIGHEARQSQTNRDFDSIDHHVFSRLVMTNADVIASTAKQSQLDTEFQIKHTLIKHTREPLTLRPLWDDFQTKALPKEWKALAPKKVILSQPALWIGDQLIWVAFH